MFAYVLVCATILCATVFAGQEEVHGSVVSTQLYKNKDKLYELNIVSTDYYTAQSTPIAPSNAIKVEETPIVATYWNTGFNYPKTKKTSKTNTNAPISEQLDWKTQAIKNKENNAGHR